jgi:hypothetical protein
LSKYFVDVIAPTLKSIIGRFLDGDSGMRLDNRSRNTQNELPIVVLFSLVTENVLYFGRAVICKY